MGLSAPSPMAVQAQGPVGLEPLRDREPQESPMPMEVARTLTSHFRGHDMVPTSDANEALNAAMPAALPVEVMRTLTSHFRGHDMVPTSDANEALNAAMPGR
mmetsp:Transcript_48316/g.135352  ORF Transcript_48316/g.135352 Transcript_48316/m.135352 type:complete len:102 (-) Transcript_48316:248-553(-)